MLLKTNNLKFTINLKPILLSSITLLAVNVILAQEIIEEKVQDTVKAFDSEKLVNFGQTNDAINTFKAQKVDTALSIIRKITGRQIVCTSCYH